MEASWPAAARPGKFSFTRFPMNKRWAGAFMLVLLALSSTLAQQHGEPVLPAPLPKKLEASAGITWSIERAFAAHSLKGEAFGYVSFSPDGKTLATAASDGSARLWTLDGEPLARVENSNMVFKVRFDASG